MYKRYVTRLLYLLSVCTFVCILTACATTTDTLQSSKTPLSTTPTSASAVSTPTAIIPSGPGVDCPAAGVVRQAVMTPLTLGVHQSILYRSQSGTLDTAAGDAPGTGSLARYDVTASSKTTLVSLENTRIGAATISKDGQWIAFTALLYDAQTQQFGQTKLQIVRVDGKQLQTLYCFSSDVNVHDYISWSPNQTRIALATTVQGTTQSTLVLLNIVDSSMQRELNLGQGPLIYSYRWLDDQHIYVRYTSLVGSSSLYVLDTQKGAQQQTDDLKEAFHQTGDAFCWDAAESIDGSALYVSQCATQTVAGAAGAERAAPSSIGTQSPLGGTLQQIASLRQLAVRNIMVASSTELIVNVYFPDANDARNGLWKVGVDGSNLVQLTKEVSWSEDASNLWTNVSRDGTMYVYGVLKQTASGSTYTLKYGMLSGGTPIAFDSGAGGNVIGWTTL